VKQIIFTDRAPEDIENGKSWYNSQQENLEKSLLMLFLNTLKT
jgi:hypothetical protein